MLRRLTKRVSEGVLPTRGSTSRAVATVVSSSSLSSSSPSSSDALSRRRHGRCHYSAGRHRRRLGQHHRNSIHNNPVAAERARFFSSNQDHASSTSTPLMQMATTCCARAASSSSSSSTTSSNISESAATTTAATTKSTEFIPEAFWEELEEASMWRPNESDWNPDLCRKVVTQYDGYLEQLVHDKNAFNPDDKQRLLDALTVTTAFKTLLKCKFDSPADLRLTVRLWERRIGRLGQTPLTDHVSLRLLTANAKAGNLGRCLSLLELRARRRYRPRPREFHFCVTAVRVAAGAAAAASAARGATGGTHADRSRRNLFATRPGQLRMPLEDPTRWLDAILIRMKDRGEPLTTALACDMLQCYIGTGGYTGRAVHHFFRVKRQPVEPIMETETCGAAGADSVDADGDDDERPRHWFYAPQQQTHVLQPTQVKLVYKKQPPPFYKVPTQCRQQEAASVSPVTLPVPLQAAFAFADSLQHGACGHDPVPLDVKCYNALLQACVVRGALTKAMHCIDRLMPAHGVPPNAASFNWLLAGLARVGDVPAAQEYYQKMLHQHKLRPDGFTVQALVDGFLNRGDAPAAITTVQNCFNQHSVLPPHPAHCKIMEFCLAGGLPYEARRHAYFLQQLWHWKPNPRYHSPQFIRLMERTQRNEQLRKPALKRLFAYFGERLEDSDFI